MLPETYAFEHGATRAALVERAAAAMAHALAQVWEQREDGLPLASPQEMLTLASMVERETARPEERPLVAAVFLNRLRRGMKLQSDPTVAYGVSGGGHAGASADRADLDGHAVQHLSRDRAAARADRQPGAGVAAGGGTTRPAPRISISSPTAAAGTASPHAGRAKPQRGPLARPDRTGAALTATP